LNEDNEIVREKIDKLFDLLDEFEEIQVIITIQNEIIYFKINKFVFRKQWMN
jgi:hypothetical protein